MSVINDLTGKAARGHTIHLPDPAVPKLVDFLDQLILSRIEITDESSFLLLEDPCEASNCSAKTFSSFCAQDLQSSHSKKHTGIVSPEDQSRSTGAGKLVDVSPVRCKGQSIDPNVTASSYPLQPESHRQDCGFPVLSSKILCQPRLI